MVDSLIKGAGIQGQAVIAIKNAIIKIAEEADKKMDVLMNVKNISPKDGNDADAAMDLLINKK